MKIKVIKGFLQIFAGRVGMKFNLKLLAIFFITTILLYVVNITPPINWGLSSSIIVVAILIIFLGELNKKKLSINYLVMVATMSAFAAIGRILFVGIASFQPMSFIVMITGYTWGKRSGFLVGAVGAFISNLYLGQGPWTSWQMLGWGLCGILAGFLGERQNSLRYIYFIALAGFCGIFYGLIINVWHWLAFTYPLNTATFIAVFTSSLPFDIMHLTGNILFAIILAKPFYNILSKYKKYI